MVLESLTTRGRRKLLHLTSAIRGFAWAPDEKSIVYSTNSSGTFRLWRVRRVDGKLLRFSAPERRAISRCSDGFPFPKPHQVFWRMKSEAFDALTHGDRNTLRRSPQRSRWRPVGYPAFSIDADRFQPDDFARRQRDLLCLGSFWSFELVVLQIRRIRSAPDQLLHRVRSRVAEVASHSAASGVRPSDWLRPGYLGR